MSGKKEFKTGLFNKLTYGKDLRKAGIVTLLFIAGITVVSVFFVLSVYFGAFGKLHSREELKNYENAVASVVLSSEGDLIGKFFSENRTNISYHQLPPYLIDALIATEDARFYNHRGIDTRSLLRVFIKSVILQDRSAGGGSTISQQLAKNIFGRKSHGILTLPVNKVKEAIVAYRLENTFSKEEIITLYLNTVSFGENVFGIEAAARRFFSKKVEELTIEESALLTGMLKANTSYNPRLFPENAKIRRNVVLNQMEKYGYLSSAENDSLSILPVKVKYSNIEVERPAGYFMRQVRNEVELILQRVNSETDEKWNLEEDGLVIQTTLSLTLQNHAMNAMAEHLSSMQKRLDEQFRNSAGSEYLRQMAERELVRLNLAGRADEVRERRMFSWDGSYNKSVSVADSILHALKLLHGGLIAIDPQTGGIKAWVGGIDYVTQPFDQVLARRQIASTFKPVLYAAALERGVNPCRYFDNDSITLAGYNDWSPVNYDYSYGGRYSLSGALIKSMNIPSFNLFLNVGFGDVDSLWRKMGFNFRLQNAPSLALGTAEATLMEVAIAYSSFANGGFKIGTYCIESVTTPEGLVIYIKEPENDNERIISERTSILMSAMLQRAIVEGTGTSIRNIYNINLPLAGKTGTSQNYGDAWFAAFNPKMVIVSRVGASSQAIHFNSGSYGSGSALALPIVALTLKDVQQDALLSGQLFSPFPGLSPEIIRLLDCPNYKEKNIFDNFRDWFKNDVITYDTDTESPRETRKKPLFRRLIRR
jgi:penicillin-binding protein 1A